MAQLVRQISRQTWRCLVNNQSNISDRIAVQKRSIAATQIKMERLFTKTHEWVEVDDQIATIGISNYAQEALGDVVYVEMPMIGSKINEGDVVGALESVKAASELISPVSGLVILSNGELEEKPGLINSSCYSQGWIYKVKMEQPPGSSELMKEEDYEEFLKSEPESH